MKSTLILVLLAGTTCALATAEPGKRWWSDATEAALVRAGSNRGELEKALYGVAEEQRKGMEFLVLHMPPGDLTSLRADFLLANVRLAYQARKEFPWGRAIPEDIFLNDVLPYANIDEKRDPWRQDFYELCRPIVKDCKTASEAAIRLNSEIFKRLKVSYSTQRRAPNQSPRESIETGKASCTGLSIVLVDACRAVGVPARVVGTPLWANKRGNHTWVEIWDRDWHFTGACEQDPGGLNRGWFIGDAAQARKDSFEHAIYAASFKKTEQHFPLVWALNHREVPAENVTDRYAKKSAPTATHRILVRVVNEAGKRIVVPVSVSPANDPGMRQEGKSRGETADTNDLLTFEVPPDREMIVIADGKEKRVKSGAAGQQQTVEFVAAQPTAPGEGNASARAVTALRAALAGRTEPLGNLADRDFAKVPLTKADAATAREMIWQAHADRIRKERAAELKGLVLTEKNLEMPFTFKTFGMKPAGGRSLWISLHGGGGAPRQVNDQQWENQKRLYTVEEGIYLAPRAPTNTWNLWHEPHIDRFFARLIEDLIVLEDVNPDRVYLLGYSAGGDGVYQMAPRMADRWAGAAMMAGHPNGVSLLSLRNVPFALQVGALDAAYNRNKVGREYGEQLAKLKEADPKGYEHFVRIHENKGHWMDLLDKAALPWMARFTRNPVPDRVVWKQTGVPHTRSYWLAVPPAEAKGDSLVIAQRSGQTIELVTTEKIGSLLIRLDDRMLDLDRPVIVTQGGKELYRGQASRTLATLLETLADRGDPRLMFDAEIRVEPRGEK